MIAQLLFLDSEEPEKDIMLYINSPGGHVSAGLAIYDTMQYLHCDVATICMGQAASMGSFLLAAGTKGKRYALPHSRVMIHQPLAGFQGQATDIEIHAREILKTRDTLNELYAKHTGQPVDKIKNDTERDNFMSAPQAKEYGIIDEVLDHREEEARREEVTRPSGVEPSRLELLLPGSSRSGPRSWPFWQVHAGTAARVQSGDEADPPGPHRHRADAPRRPGWDIFSAC